MMLFPRLSIQQEAADNGEYDSDASAEDVTEQEQIDAAKAATKGDVEELSKTPICIRRTIGGVPLIHLSAQTSHAEMCEYLIKYRNQGVDDKSKDGATALHVACGRYGSDEVAIKLLRYHANPNVVDVEGWSSLHYAARAGRISTCWLLLQAGAYPIQESSNKNNMKTPSMIALTFKQNKLAKILQHIETKFSEGFQSVEDIDQAFDVSDEDNEDKEGNNLFDMIEKVRCLLKTELMKQGLPFEKFNSKKKVDKNLSMLHTEQESHKTGNDDMYDGMQSPNTEEAIEQLSQGLNAMFPSSIPPMNKDDIRNDESKYDVNRSIRNSTTSSISKNSYNKQHKQHGVRRGATTIQPLPVQHLSPHEFLNKLLDEVERGIDVGKQVKGKKMKNNDDDETTTANNNNNADDADDGGANNSNSNNEVEEDDDIFNHNDDEETRKRKTKVRILNRRKSTIDRAKLSIKYSLELKGKKSVKANILQDLLNDKKFDNKSYEAFYSILKTIKFGLNMFNGFQEEFQPKHFQSIDDDDANDILVSNMPTTHGSSSHKNSGNNGSSGHNGGGGGVNGHHDYTNGLPVLICANALSEVMKDVLIETLEPNTGGHSIGGQSITGSSLLGGGGGGGGINNNGASSVGSSSTNGHHNNNHHKSYDKKKENQKRIDDINEKQLLAESVCMRAAIMFADIEPYHKKHDFEQQHKQKNTHETKNQSPEEEKGYKTHDNDNINQSEATTMVPDEDSEKVELTADNFFQTSYLMSADGFVLFSRFVVSMAIRFIAQK